MLADKPSIAVLPFANMSGDPDQEYFVDGMVEEIITALSRIRWLFVIARNSSFTYKGQHVDIKQVGRELGVRYVLEGSVRKAGSRVRITGQLIDAATSAHLWADRFDGLLQDVFDMQDQVASSVAGVIEPALQAAETARSAGLSTTALTAYDLHLRGYAMVMSRSGQAPEALRLMEQAIARDPGYGPALAWAAFCCARLMIDGESQDPLGGRQKGIDFARRAHKVAGDDAGVRAYLSPKKSASSALDRRAVASPGFDRVHIGRALEGLRCRLTRPAGPADRRKEVVQPGRQIGPGHFELTRSIIDDLVFDPGAGINGGARNERVRHPVDQNRAFPFKAEQDLLIRGVTVLANVAPWRNDLDPHRQIVGTAMLGAKFDDRIAIRPNRLPIGLALFGLQYNPCPFWHAHDDLPLRRFPAKFLASRLSGQSVFTAFRVPMLRVNSLCYGSGTDGSQTRRRREPPSNHVKSPRYSNNMRE
jgi:TolB-like protein